MITPFTVGAPTFSISVTDTASTSKPIGSNKNLRIVNTSYNIVYLSVGIGTQTATIPSSTATKTCTPLLAQSDLTFSVDNISEDVQISAICDTGNTATILVSYGDGI